MAKVALRKPRGRMSQVIGSLVIASLMFGFAIMANAQNTTPGKPKVAVVKPEEKKTEPKTVTPEPKTTTPEPSKNEPSVPAANTTTSPGFGAIDEPVKIINEYFANSWKENSIQPAARCDDYEFARRAFLDIIGRIPTVAEIDQYMKDPPATRRGQLLDRLLTGELKGAYASNWATIWTNWLMTRTGPNLFKQQIHLWLEEAFSTENPVDGTPKPHMSYKEMVEQLVTASGATNDNGAVNYILAHLGGPNPAGRAAQDGAFDVVPITARTVRLFLGYQIQCTQCHDHPFNADWKQKHFWGVNTFFRQVERVGNPGMNQNQQMQMQGAPLRLRDNTGYNTKGIVFYEKRNGVFLPSEPVFLDGRRIPAGGQLTRREELARFITSHKNFGGAYVNRMWGHLFGRGLNVKPQADDFGEHNEVVHPELLAKLSEQFERTGSYDPRKLLKWICSSDPYNLKAVANPTNIVPEAEPYFARMGIKMMSPEQLLESLITATKPAGAEDGVVRDAQRNLRAQWMNVLVRNFGDDEGNEATYNGTILQALLMMNGRDLNNAISTNGSGTVKKAMDLGARDPKLTVDYLFKATVSRPANPKEYQQIIGVINKIGLRDQANAGPLQDLFWALLNSNEFVLNH